MNKVFCTSTEAIRYAENLITNQEVDEHQYILGKEGDNECYLVANESEADAIMKKGFEISCFMKTNPKLYFSSYRVFLFVRPEPQIYTNPCKTTPHPFLHAPLPTACRNGCGVGFRGCVRMLGPNWANRRNRINSS